MANLRYGAQIVLVMLLLSATARASRTPPKAPEGFANIACTARISCAPKGDTDILKTLVDGNFDPQQSFAFPVKSKGPGVFTFRFRRPRTVTGLHFLHPHQWYLIHSFRVMADVQGKGQFTQKLAAGTAAHTEFPAWGGVNWKPTEVHGLKLVPVTGYSGANRAYPCLAEIVIFGKPLPTDQADAIASGNAATNITAVKPVSREIDLSGATRPLVILVPRDAAWRTLGEQLVAELKRKFAITATLTDDPTAALPDTRNVIALGNVNNNQLLARLYFNNYVYADSLFPGDDEFTLRTVFDPYPWHTKGDVVAIGCSNLKGAERGVAEFYRQVNFKKKSIAYTLMVSAPAAMGPSKPPTRAFDDFRLLAPDYFKTGSPTAARALIASLETIAKSYSDAEAQGKPRPHIQWADEMFGSFALNAWDAFEEYPALTDEQRLRFTRAFMFFMDGLTHHVSGWSGLEQAKYPAYNHTIYPLSAVYACARYFDAYYNLGRAKKYLKKCDAAFMAQARCWKPSEDADGYLEATLEPCRRYWLGEWKLDFFNNGNMRTYAEYQIAIHDNRGFNSGFGDSGMGRNPDRHADVLQLAFWHNRDPRYAWLLNHYTDNSWKNPFHRGLEPLADTAHIGLRVFPLAKDIYEWTDKGSVYGVPRRKPNVPLRQSFDKISFRESWNKEHQYMLLDGYGHGHHLHFDGNAIIDFVDRGVQWLIDHDYLIRNTTEHNMISVIRNGRSDQLPPSCAALVASADNDSLAMTATELRDYMGADWRRSIFWKKGGYFVVMDRVQAKQAGEFAVDCTWKTINNGDEQITAPGVFRIGHADISAGTRDVTVINDPNASRGKALLMGETTSRWAFVAPAPPGKYRVTLTAYGMNGSSDSLFLATAGTARAEAHVGTLRYGSSRGSWRDNSGPSTVEFKSGNRHVVSVWMREQPPVRVDKISITDMNGKPVFACEAEDAPAPTAADLGDISGSRFWLKCADAIQTRITRYTSRGIAAPLCKLWQRRAATLAPDQALEIANIFYTEATDDAMTFDLRRLAPNTVLVTGDDLALCTTGPVKLGDLETDAALLFLSADRIAYAGGALLHIGSTRIALTEKDAARITLTPAQSNVVQQFLAQLAATAPTRTQTLAGVKAINAAPQWTRACHGQVRRLRARDLDGDGRDEILVAAGGQALVFAADGSLRWSFRSSGRCNDINAGQITPDPGLEVVIAASDHYLYLLTAAGKLLHKVENRGTPRYSKIGDMPHEPLTAAILNTDGAPRVFVADTGYKLQTYDAQLKETWEQWRGCTFGGDEFHAADVNRDGKQEVFVTDHYGGLVPFDHLGRVKPRYYTSIGDMQAALGDVDGDGVFEAVYGSTTGDLRCSRIKPTNPFTGDATTLWSFNNFGYPVNRIRMADLDGDGKDETIVASGTGYLYVLDAEGKVKWRHLAQTNVADVIVLKGTPARLALIDTAGTLTTLDAAGKSLRALRLKDAPRLLVECAGKLIIASEDAIAGY